jgi:hypothetical protein
MPNVVPRLTVLGGLTTNDHYYRVLRDALRTLDSEISIRRLDTPPVLGALRRARRLAEDT